MARPRGDKYLDIDSLICARAQDEQRQGRKSATSIIRRIVTGCIEGDPNFVDVLASLLPTATSDFDASPPEPRFILGGALAPVFDSAGELRAWVFMPTRQTVRIVLGAGTVESIVRRIMGRLERQKFRVRGSVKGELPPALRAGRLAVNRRRGPRPKLV